MEIQNYEIYNAGMAKTLMDKIWWLDKIDEAVDTIIDFGCADASIMGLIETIQPNRFQYIGIDNNSEMLRMAKINAPKGRFYSNFEDMAAEEAEETSHSIILFNSVIHELETYCYDSELLILKNQIARFKSKYIAIRDMHSFPSNDVDIRSTLDGIFTSNYVREWISYWKSTSNVHDDWADCFTEFFLKHTYKENWAREKDETYLWNWSNVSLSEYKVICESNFNIPYLSNRIKEHFGIDWSKVYTHKKVLLKIA